MPSVLTLRELDVQDSTDQPLLQEFERCRCDVVRISSTPLLPDCIAVTTRGGFVELIHIASGAFRLFLSHLGDTTLRSPLRCLSLVPSHVAAHGRHYLLYALSHSNELLLADTASGRVEVLAALQSRPSAVFCDGDTIVCGEGRGELSVWRTHAEGGAVLPTLAWRRGVFDDAVVCLTAQSDWLISSAADYCCCVVGLSSGELVAVLPQQPSPAVALQPVASPLHSAGRTALCLPHNIYIFAPNRAEDFTQVSWDCLALVRLDVEVRCASCSAGLIACGTSAGVVILLDVGTPNGEVTERVRFDVGFPVVGTQLFADGTLVVVTTVGDVWKWPVEDLLRGANAQNSGNEDHSATQEVPEEEEEVEDEMPQPNARPPAASPPTPCGDRCANFATQKRSPAPRDREKVSEYNAMHYAPVPPFASTAASATAAAAVAVGDAYDGYGGHTEREEHVHYEGCDDHHDDAISEFDNDAILVEMEAEVDDEGERGQRQERANEEMCIPTHALRDGSYVLDEVDPHAPLDTTREGQDQGETYEHVSRQLLKEGMNEAEAGAGAEGEKTKRRTGGGSRYDSEEERYSERSLPPSSISFVGCTTGAADTVRSVPAAAALLPSAPSPPPLRAPNIRHAEANHPAPSSSHTESPHAQPSSESPNAHTNGSPATLRRARGGPNGLTSPSGSPGEWAKSPRALQRLLRGTELGPPAVIEGLRAGRRMDPRRARHVAEQPDAAPPAAVECQSSRMLLDHRQTLEDATFDADAYAREHALQAEALRYRHPVRLPACGRRAHVFAELPRLQERSAEAPATDDLMEVTFQHFARRRDAQLEEERRRGGPDIRRHLCEEILYDPTDPSATVLFDEHPMRPEAPETLLLPMPLPPTPSVF